MQGDITKKLESEWLDEITGTRVDRLAAVLARGGTAAELRDGIAAVLGDDSSAQMIAETELNRAYNALLVAAYRAAGIKHVRWVTTSADPCPECVMNREAGPWPLGHPFPSGVVAPPDHPHCQCHLEPAED